MVFDLLELEIACVRWSELPANGETLEEVPGYLRLLAKAPNEQAADGAYRSIDQLVSSQCRLFDAALAIIRPLLAIAATSSSEIGRRLSIEMLDELGSAYPDPSDAEALHPAERCREMVVGGILEYYRALNGKDPLLRDQALWTISRHDPDRERRALAVEWVMNHDFDDRVRHSASRIHNNSEFEFSWVNAELKERLARGL